MYRHADTRRYLNIDERGQTYEYISASAMAPHHFRLVRIGDAILHAFAYQAPCPAVRVE